MRNIFKKINVRKGILILFAFSTAMPFLSIIGANLTTKLSDVFNVEAADDVNKLDDLPDPSGYVTAPSDKTFYDGANKMIYSLPYSFGKDVYKVDAVINLNKKCGKSIEAYYHLENYTAIKEVDFPVPIEQKIVIPAYSTSVTVALDVNETDFGVGAPNSNVYATRAFRFVLDKLVDGDGKEYEIYDGAENGYKLDSGKLCRDDVFCKCPNRYTYTTMDQYENVKKGSLKTFTDYYAYLEQTYGNGPGSVEKNNYDMGGAPQKKKVIVDSTYIMDNEDGRHYEYEGVPTAGGLRVCPYKTNNYYDTEQKKSIGPYKDWLNRIVLTNLGHSYGSFNFRLNKGHDKPSGNYVQSFFLGDYSFVTKDKERFGHWSLLNDSDSEQKFNKEAYSWGIDFRLNNRNTPHWYVTEKDLEDYRDYMVRVINGDSSISQSEELLSGYSWNTRTGLDKAAEVKKITVIDYKKEVTDSSLFTIKDQKICWFPLVGSNTPETFGFNLYHQHLGTWFWRSSIGARGQTFFTVLDDVVPTIQNSTVIETGSVAKTGKIRISVRFNEPVQSFEHSYFIADAGIGRELKFTPVPGQMEGCDTIVYETDISNIKDVYINKISIHSDILYEAAQQGNVERYKIHDYAQSGGHELPTKDQNNYLKGRTFDVLINKKLPTISQAPGEISKDPTQSATAQIIVSFLNEGKIYYSFVKDEGGVLTTPVFRDSEVSTDKVYSNCLKVSNLQNNSQVNLDLPSSSLRTGKFYCFVKGVTNMGVEKMFPVDVNTSTRTDSGMGPFIIDNTAPTITVTKDPDKFNALERKFNISVNENCAIDKVTVKFNKTYGQLSDQINTFDVPLVQSESDKSLYEGTFTLTLKSILDKYYTIKETGKHVFNPDLEYEDFSFTFTAVDKAGNKQDSYTWNGEERKTPLVLAFSAHPYIPVSVTKISNESLVSNIPNLNLYPIGTSFTFETSLAPETVGLLQASVVKLPKDTNDRKFYSTYNDDLAGYSISQGDPQEKNKSIVTINKPGYYEIVVRNEEQCYSDPFKFYISDNLSERTPNYINAMESTNLVPKNNAWQLNSDSRMYYLDESAAYHSEAYEGIQDPLFSSKNAAKKYIKGHEYEDLYLIQINSQVASILNGSGGAAGYQRANSETTVARQGQYWIRYKNTNWSITSQTSTAWGYYFYCEPISSNVTIEEEIIKKNNALSNQIEKVSEMLASNGKTIYLVDDDHIDPKTGAPKLTLGQLEATKEFVITKTHSNSPVNSIVITGDNEMYANFVTVNDGTGYKSYRLATNLPLVMNENIMLFATLAIGEEKYRRIECEDGTPLKEALNSEEGVATSGIYKILEISPEGARTFEVYVDKDNPLLEIKRSVYDQIEGQTVSVTTTVDGSINVDFYSKEFQINGYPEKDKYLEVDDFAYVAVFKRDTLFKFAYISQLQGNPMTLEDGIYVVVVGDRSGNRYSFRAFVSGSDINVSFKTSANNSKLTIEVTNREEAELLKFDAYYNNELISSDLNNPKVYTKSGVYFVVVQDQYGNKIKTEPYTFTKAMPEIQLFYIDGGLPYPYKENDPNPHIILSQGDESMSIKTCSMLKITYDPATTAIYVDKCPESYYVNNETDGSLVFNTACSFDFYVYYKDNPEEYVKYEVVLDEHEPTIDGEYGVQVYELEDLKVINFDTKTNTPNTLDYIASTSLDGSGPITKLCTINNGDELSGEYLYFKVSDNTKVKSVSVTRNGVDVPIDLINQDINGFEFILEGIPGKYVIVATDIFNKTTSLTFTVDNSDFSKATVDGAAVNPVGPLTQDGHQVIYGNQGATIVCNAGSIVTIRYKDANGTYAYRFVCNHNESYFTKYALFDDDGNPIVTDKDEKTPIPSLPFKPIEGVDLTISIDNNGVITINYVAGFDVSNLDIRVDRKEQEYNLYNMEFCKKLPRPEFYDGENRLEPADHYVYGSKEAKLVDPYGDIVKVYIAYNPLGEEFDEASYVEYTSDYKFQNGFYSYIIVNKYGVSDKYTVVISDKFEATVTLTYYNKDSETYSIKYSDTYSSNKTITVVGYNIVEMTEAHNHGEVIMEDGKTTIIFTEPGVYTLYIVDKYNNRATLSLTINSVGIQYNEEWMTGYNEDALLKDQGYTNQKLTINLTEEQVKGYGINQIYYIYNGQKTILYGYAGSDISLPFNPEILKDVIGSQGDGIYYVYFSNKYGDVCVKEIHYQVAPTLHIERTTNLSDTPDEITVDDATKNGVWANMKANLSTTLNEGQYILLVKTNESSEFEKQNINYLFELTNSAAYGEIHYTVRYIDAYGNIYEFTINLLRRQLAFNKDNIKLVSIDNANFTKENFFFDFDSNDVSVIYSFNSGDYVDYEPKALLFKDGMYEFIMIDKAGNQMSFVVTKDSIVTFQVKVDGKDQNIYSGAAFNGETVSISSPITEDVTLVSVKLNGEKINTSNLEFTKTGIYELILKDKVGNLRYFKFYLVSNELNAFEYTTANDYFVSTGSFINLSGIKVTCMDKITENGTHINLLDAEEGIYEFQIKNKYDNSITLLTIVIDRQLPDVKLNGCENGGVTTKDVTLTNLSSGDLVTIYRDGKKVQEVEVGLKPSIDAITTGGKYRIVIKNKAGSVVEFNFEKTIIANGALSALVIIGLLGLSGGFFAVSLLRNRAKNDD